MAKSQRSLFPILFIGVLLLIVALLAIPKFRKMEEETNRANAFTNAKQLAIALTEFDSLYGGFPSEETKQLLIDEGEKIQNGDTANTYLSQLLISQALDSEKVFYVPRLPGTKEGDDVFDSPSTALAQGENGWGYVRVKEAKLTKGPRSRSEPVLVAPLVTGGPKPKFDPHVYKGSGIVLHLDSTVTIYRIDSQGDLIHPKTSTNIFLNGEDTIWGSSDTPDVKAPWFLE